MILFVTDTFAIGFFTNTNEGSGVFCTNLTDTYHGFEKGLIESNRLQQLRAHF